jgi:hypothetical protein
MCAYNAVDDVPTCASADLKVISYLRENGTASVQEPVAQIRTGV